MGSHCGKVLKSKSKTLSHISPSSSHIENTTDPQEHQETSPHLSNSQEYPINFGSNEDVRKIYEINPEIIGKGNFSTVRMACLTNGGPNALRFSLKSVLRSHLDPHLQSLLGQELQILKNFNHPCIVKFYEAFQDAKFVHFLLEYLEGGDLLNYLCNKSNGILQEHEAKRLMYKLFTTVAYLHRNGIVHRDLKPENLLFPKNGNFRELKLIDFGLSRKTEIKNFNNMRTIVGSPYYIAPEILKKAGYDSSCDVWSLGVILYLCLQGNPPFFNENIQDLFHMIENQPFEFSKEVEISDKAKDLIEKMLKKDPKQRISLKEALKHEFFNDVILEMKAYKPDFKTNTLKEILQNMQKNRVFFKDRYKTIRNLFLEFGLQYMNTDQQEILEKYYRFFDRKLKGEISLKLFSKRIKSLGLTWSDSEISGLIRDLNEAFIGEKNEKNLCFHSFSLGLIGNMENCRIDLILENIWKNMKIDKEWINKAFSRKIMKLKDIKELDGIDMRELMKKVIGHSEEMDEGSGDEGVEKVDFKHCS